MKYVPVLCGLADVGSGLIDCVRFEVCGPQTFRKGDIVEVQLSFIVVPTKEDIITGNKYKFLVVLRSLALLDTQFSMVSSPSWTFVVSSLHACF
jgi:hypothetical protein